MKRNLLTFGLLAFMALCFSQAPEKFNYQLVLHDQYGAVMANEQTTILISILSGDIQGPSVYIENHSIITNDFGLAHLIIGSGSVVSGSIAGINWATGPYFIKTWVNGNEVGTSQLLTVPYALYATRAAKVDSGFSGNYNDLVNKPQLASVATSGDFKDLKNKPVLESDNYYELLDTVIDGSDTVWTDVLDLSECNSASITFQWQNQTGELIIEAFESLDGNNFNPANCPVLTAHEVSDYHTFFIPSKVNNYWKFKIIGNQLSIQSWAIKSNFISEFKSAL